MRVAKVCMLCEHFLFFLYKTERWFLPSPFKFACLDLRTSTWAFCCLHFPSLSSLHLLLLPALLPPSPYLVINNFSKECSSFFYFRSYCTLGFEDVINYFGEVNPRGPGLRSWQAGPFQPTPRCSRAFPLMSLLVDEALRFLQYFQLTIKICAQDF